MRFLRRFFLTGAVILFLSVTAGLAGVDVKVNQDIDNSVQNEPSITINRHFTGDPLNIVVAYNDIGKSLGISYSPDSGQTWYDVQLPQKWATTGDPSVASDNLGNVYACFLSFQGTFFYDTSGIYVCKSTDGGRTWSNPVTVDELGYTGSGPPVKFADKCMMTVDTNSSSQHVNNIYVGWQRDDTNGLNSDIFFARSTDGGATFTTPPLQINDNSPQSAFAEGAFPFVGADGDVYVAWYDAYFRGHEPGSLYVDKSTDGGQTFGTDVRVANILAPSLYTFGNSGFKAKSFVSAAGDPNSSEDLYMTYISDPDGYFDKRIDNGKAPGVPGNAPSDLPVIARSGSFVYAAWQDYRSGAASDIYFNRSTDDGQSWDLPDKGSLDNTDTPGANNSQMQKISASGSFVYCAWHDYRSPAGFVDIYFNRSTDFGKTWQTDVHIDGSVSASSMYPAITSTGNYVYTTWQDTRSGNDDIYFNRSTDNGMSWGTATRIDAGDAPGANSSRYPQLACQGNNVYCMWLDDRTGGTYHPYFNYSTDNGATWQPSSTKLSQGSGFWCQLPLCGGIECTGSHVYACWWDDRDATGVYQVFFNRSTNNGINWGTDVRVSDSTGNACFDPSMDIQGNYVYIGWEDYRISGFGEMFFDYSTDNGATWQKPDIGPLDPGAIGMPGKAVNIKSDGNNVYATWYDSRRYGPGTGDIFFSRSTNNGVTWQGDIQINTGPWLFNLQSNYPVMAAGNGYVNIVWPDPRFFGLPNIYTNYSSDNGATWLSGQDEADVFCVRSTNGGVNWQTPVTVNDDGTIYSQVLPWVVVKINGLVDISYYHFRMSPLNMWAPGAELRMAVSSDGGTSFTPSFAVQDTVVTPVTQWVGEYNGMAVLDSFVYTVFTDLEQTDNSDIFIDRTDNPTVNEVTDEAGSRERPSEFTLLQNYPNPFNQTTKMQFTLAKSGFVSLSIYDLLGRKVRTLVSEHVSVGYKSVLWDGRNDAGKGVASGIYFYQLRVGDFFGTKKLVLLK